MKLFNSIKKKFFPDYEMNEKEQLIYDVVKNLCAQEDTDLKVAPLSHKYFMVNKRLLYWVRLDEFGVTITNHKFTLSNSCTTTYHQMLLAMVEQSIERNRNEFEEAVFQNEVDLLHTIKNNIESGSAQF